MQNHWYTFFFIPFYSIPSHSGSTNACLSPTCEPCSLLYLTPSTSLLPFSSLSDSFWWPRAAPVFVFSLISLPPSNSSSPGGALGKLCPTDRTLSLASDVPYYPRGSLELQVAVLLTIRGCCTPETNVILHVSFIPIYKKTSNIWAEKLHVV